MANKWILTQNEKRTEYTDFEEAVRHFRSVIAKEYNDMDEDFSTYLIDGGRFFIAKRRANSITDEEFVIGKRFSYLLGTLGCEDAKKASSAALLRVPHDYSYKGKCIDNSHSYPDRKREIKEKLEINIVKKRNIINASSLWNENGNVCTFKSNAFATIDRNIEYYFILSVRTVGWLPQKDVYGKRYRLSVSLTPQTIKRKEKRHV